MTKPKQQDNWYDKNIEPKVRKLVRLLRDNGFNTECSCEGTKDGKGKPNVQLQYMADGEVQRLHDLLFSNGYMNYVIKVHYKVWDGHSYPSMEVVIDHSPEGPHGVLPHNGFGDVE